MKIDYSMAIVGYSRGLILIWKWKTKSLQLFNKVKEKIYVKVGIYELLWHTNNCHTQYERMWEVVYSYYHWVFYK